MPGSAFYSFSEVTQRLHESILAWWNIKLLALFR